MIKQLRMGLKMLRYAHGIKSCIVWCVIVLLLGALFEVGADGSNSVFTGIYLVMMLAIWPLQLLVSLNVPNVVAASPWKKKIQTSVTALISFCGFLIAFAVVGVMEGNKFATGRIAAEDFTFNVLFAACFAVLLMIYMAFSTKYFVVSTIGFIIAMSSSSIVINLMQYTDLAIFDQSLHPAATVLLGIFFIIIGAVLEYGISLLIYKVPVSKYAQMNSLRKKM